MARAFLSLGSNLGDRRQHLRDAVAGLPGVVGVSDVYETDPVGGPDQDRYLNLVVALEGPVALTECSSVGGCCDLESHCRVGAAWQKINHSIRKALESVTLADLQRRPEPLPAAALELELCESVSAEAIG